MQKRNVEIWTKAALKKNFRKESELRYDFGSISLPKWQKIACKKKENTVKLADKPQGTITYVCQSYYCMCDDLPAKESLKVIDPISPQPTFFPSDGISQLTEVEMIVFITEV